MLASGARGGRMHKKTGTWSEGSFFAVTSQKTPVFGLWSSRVGVSKLIYIFGRALHETDDHG
eukprot:9495660-Pyramimonas_sp.AAC.1